MTEFHKWEDVKKKRFKLDKPHKEWKLDYVISKVDGTPITEDELQGLWVTMVDWIEDHKMLMGGAMLPCEVDK